MSKSSPRDQIITLPNKRLRSRSRHVKTASKTVKNMIDTMEAATLDWEDNRVHEAGVALAAVQIGKLVRLIVIRNNFEDKKDRTFKAYINPEIVKTGGKIVEDFEGCLSVPDIYGKVPRHSKVTVRATDLSNKPVLLKVDGFLARVFQHEIDHTDGILFIDHIKDQAEAFFRLNDEGKLVTLDYEKDIRKSRILW